jgi:hypothetical protein
MEAGVYIPSPHQCLCAVGQDSNRTRQRTCRRTPAQVAPRSFRRVMSGCLLGRPRFDSCTPRKLGHGQGAASPCACMGSPRFFMTPRAHKIGPRSAQQHRPNAPRRAPRRNACIRGPGHGPGAQIRVGPIDRTGFSSLKSACISSAARRRSSRWRAPPQCT